MLDGSSTCSLHEVCLKILATFLSHWLSPFDWNVHFWNSSWFGSWQMSAGRSRNLLTWNNPLISRITILYSESPKNQEHLSHHPISELLTVHWATSRNIKPFQKVFVSHSLNTPPARKSVCMTLVSHKHLSVSFGIFAVRSLRSPVSPTWSREMITHLNESLK